MTLKTTNFIKTHGWDKLSELSIKVNKHPDGRIILNYDQINSPKENEIVRECRALTVNEQGDLIARSFSRFFNLNECLSITKKFRWDMPIKTWDKEDGSLCKVFFYNGGWKVQTRNSFADAKLQDYPYTWRELVEMAYPRFGWVDTSLTYVCELCSPYNRVVRHYEYPTLFLLACFNGIHELEDEIVDEIARDLGLRRPAEHVFRDSMDAVAYIAEQERIDKTFEGVVLKDINGMRLKVKSPTYLRLSHTFNNGNVLLPQYLIPIMLNGELDEVASYFPEVRERARLYQSKIDEVWKEVESLWFCFHDEDNKKKFALAVKDSKYSYSLFEAKNKGGHPRDYFFNTDYLVKVTSDWYRVFKS